MLPRRLPRRWTVGVPAGFEVAESINGVVSVRRVRAPADPIPAADLRVVEVELGRHAHLRHHKVHAESGEILIYAPDTSPDVYSEAGRFGHLPLPGMRERATAQLIARMRYSPVMKFVREGSSYAAMRMTYRGEGGWSWPLASGPIATLAKRFVRPIGTDDFFELY